mgnify:CR=1 FL=1
MDRIYFMDKLIITRLQGKTCTVRISGGEVLQLTFEEEQEKSLLGNIYIAKVQKVAAGINAAFVELAPGMVGYYSLEENKEHLFTTPSSTGGIPRKLKAGDEIVVQVSRDAVKTKAPVVTSHLSFAGRYCVLTAGKSGIGFSSKLTDNGLRTELKMRWKECAPGDMGLIVRTNAAAVTADEVLKEYEALKETYEALKAGWAMRTCYSCIYHALPGYIASLRDTLFGGLDSILTDQPDFYEAISAYLSSFQPEDKERLSFYEDRLLPLSKLYSLDTALERALSKRVWLKSGGYLVIEPTEAMVVIDVNTGKYTGKKSQEETIVKINLEAADEIGRQLRLRNLSGIILIDFIDMEKELHKKQVMEALQRAVSKDPVKTVVVEMTRLNLVEVTRKKVRKPLYEQILL